MRKTDPRPIANGTSAARSSACVVEQEYGEISPEHVVEHLSVPAFLRRVANRWHMQDINRFGDAVGRSAEALQLAYLTRIDLSLGQIRIFPVPLLKRVYETMAPQFGWPRIVDGQLTDNVDRVLLRKMLANQKLDKILEAMVSSADNEEARNSISLVRELIEAENRKIRESQNSQSGGEQ